MPKHHSIGSRKDPEYGVYYKMKTRCYDKAHVSWRNYGGRGVIVCDRWLYGENGMTGYDCFLTDMGKRPTPDHQLDRHPDNNGHYNPANCRWTTRKENNRHKRTSRIIAAFGDTKTLAEWSEDPRCGVNSNTLLYRLKLGWQIEEAITTPVGRYTKHKALVDDPSKLLKTR